MTLYLIAFNDEWVRPHTHEELVAKSAAGGEVLAEMEAAGVFVFADGALSASTVVCSVEAKAGKSVSGPRMGSS